jgi:hypothetical protein
MNATEMKHPVITFEEFEHVRPVWNDRTSTGADLPPFLLDIMGNAAQGKAACIQGPGLERPRGFLRKVPRFNSESWIPIGGAETFSRHACKLPENT